MGRPADPAWNLLIGALALRLDLGGPGAIVDALNEWDRDRGRSLAPILTRRGVLDGRLAGSIEGLATALLEAHGSDARRALASLSAGDLLRDSLTRLTDPGLRTTITHLIGGDGPDPFATRVPTEAAPGAEEDARRFHTLRLHARGGLGEVFLARDQSLDRDVALKEIQPRYADHPESRARFLREARVTGALEHPGVVPVYALGRYPDGRPFYVMRFIRGESLGDAVAAYHAPRPRSEAASPGERALGLRRLLRRFVDVCNTVDYAHSRGVLHRDLKPDNVMLGPFGETLVVDWGLAKRIGEPGDEPRPDPFKTKAGATMGTPAYMSPEQASGRSEDAGPASDVYGLGATLYCLLTGRAPFQGEDFDAMLDQVRRGDFPPPRAVRRDVPPALNAVCLKAMALKPARRYDSARALADDVERWLADEPVAAYREWLPRRLWRWGRHHRWVAAVIGAVSIVIVAVFLASSLVAVAAAVALAALGGGVGALAGLLQGGARHGARRGAQLGFQIGLAVGIVAFLAWIVYEAIHLAR